MRPVDGEEVVRAAFARVLPSQTGGGAAADVAQQWFFETVVRVHRAGQHAAYTGLKPAGLDVGPVIPLAEKAVESDDVEEVYGLLAADLRRQLTHRLEWPSRGLRSSPTAHRCATSDTRRSPDGPDLPGSFGPCRHRGRA